MPKKLHNELTARSVQTLGPGRHADGQGLYLLVKPDGNRSWIFRWRDRVTGKLRDKGLGPVSIRSLQSARNAAKACAEVVLDGGDPINAKRLERQTKALELARKKTFGQCVNLFLADKESEWRNAKHRQQWRNTLTTYAAKLTPLAVAEIDTGLVMDCLRPIWTDKPTTASRTRQRIEAVLGWATANEHRKGDNPARWRGHLENLLARPNLNQEHRAAIPHYEVGAFVAELREREGQAARALELQILTATRPGEVVGATWAEFDLERAVWTIPSERMKAGKEHRIPLSAAALDLLRALPTREGWLFPGIGGRSITTAAGMKILTAMRPGMTAHGFRSTFRDWAGETTAYPREVIEHALAHQLKDKAEAAYARGTQFEKRARLMADWAKWCSTVQQPKGDTVTNIRRKRA